MTYGAPSEAPPPDYNTALQQGLTSRPTYAPPPGPPPATAATHVQSPTPVSPVQPASAAPSRASGLSRRFSVEDQLGSLSRYSIKILIDDSLSMASLWEDTQLLLGGLVDRCTQYVRDGIDLYWMNGDGASIKVRSVDDVTNAFRATVPSGMSTPTGIALDEILREYVESVEDAKANKTGRVKPLIVLVMTDGSADDPDMVRDILVEMASRLDEIRAAPHQLGVQFLQLGNDAEATRFLTQLDDDLKSEAGVRDLVDTLPFSGEFTPAFTLKALLGSVVKRLDSSNE